MIDGAITDKMPDEAGVRAQGRDSRRIEGAEIRAWRIEKVRRWPRRLRGLCLRIFALCLGVVALLFVLLFVLGQVLPLATTTTTKGVSRSSAPHQM